MQNLSLTRAVPKGTSGLSLLESWRERPRHREELLCSDDKLTCWGLPWASFKHVEYCICDSKTLTLVKYTAQLQLQPTENNRKISFTTENTCVVQPVSGGQPALPGGVHTAVPPASSIGLGKDVALLGHWAHSPIPARDASNMLSRAPCATAFWASKLLASKKYST